MPHIKLRTGLSASALLIALLGLLAADEVGRAGARPAQQDTERSLEIQRYPDEPLEIVDIEVGGHSVRNKVKVRSRNKLNRWGRDAVGFREKADWYKRVAVTLRNVSGRPIRGIRAYLFFKPAGARTLYSLPLARTRSLKQSPLAPGEEIVLSVHPNLLGQTLDALRADGVDPSRAELQLSVDSALFSDDLQWYRGKLMRRDPADPSRWTAVAPPAAAARRAPAAPAFTRASYKPGPARTQTLDQCQQDVGNFFGFACTGDPTACNRVEELGNGEPGLLSQVLQNGVCDEVGGVDNPNINCSAQVTHKRLEEDENCVACPDADEDGFADAACGGSDCDDTNSDIKPGAAEDCNDGVDNNCDGCSCTGEERDIWEAGGGIDCTACNDSADNDCDGDIDDFDSGCSWFCVNTPVVIDVAGDGFALTNAAGGVLFDLDGDGVPSRLAWTAAGSDDAWLALDRNGDGGITSGRELFGNFTPQPAPPAGGAPHGFLALAVYDTAAEGGNGDGRIDSRDAVFPALRLWQDVNHDGLSAPAELRTLESLDVVRLHLDYKESRRTDEHGNRFRYRAKVDDAKGAKAGRWAWDVFLVSEAAPSARYTLPPLPKLFRQWASPAGASPARLFTEALLGKAGTGGCAARRG